MGGVGEEGNSEGSEVSDDVEYSIFVCLFVFATESRGGGGMFIFRG